MEHKHNSSLVPFAKELRNNMTKEESHLWYDFLKGYAPRFQRQKIIGKYILDFYCAAANMEVELDGSQHYSAEGKENDGERTKALEEYKIKVLRFSNLEIKQNFEGVCRKIENEVKQSLTACGGAPFTQGSL